MSITETELVWQHNGESTVAAFAYNRFFMSVNNDVKKLIMDRKYKVFFLRKDSIDTAKKNSKLQKNANGKYCIEPPLAVDLYGRLCAEDFTFLRDNEMNLWYHVDPNNKSIYVIYERI